MRFRTRTASHAFVLAIAAGCYEYRVARGSLPTYSFVRVRFDPPRTLTVARDSGEFLRVDAVARLEGLVRAVRGDTLDVEVRSLWRGGAASTLGRGFSAVVTTDEQPVEVLSRNGGAVVVVLVALVALVIIDLSSLPRT